MFYTADTWSFEKLFKQKRLKCILFDTFFMVKLVFFTQLQYQKKKILSKFTY